MSFLSYSTNFQSVVDIFMNNPARYLPFTQLMAKIMDDDSDLTKVEREMIALHVSKLNECHYCVGSHRAVLEVFGVDDETINQAEAGLSNESRQVAILAFAAKLTRDPGGVAQEDIDLLLAAGCSERATEDVISIVSLFAFLNRLVDGFGIRGSVKGFSQAGEMIAQHGYKPVAQMVQEKESV